VKYIALFGIAGGAVVAAGKLTAAQWHAAGAGVLALALRYGLTVLPWLLAALFAWLWWKQRRRTWLYEQIAVGEMEQRRQYGAELWEKDRAAERRPQPRRKRATR
jgi:hypothetical protein